MRFGPRQKTCSKCANIMDHKRSINQNAHAHLNNTVGLDGQLWKYPDKNSSVLMLDGLNLLPLLLLSFVFFNAHWSCFFFFFFFFLIPEKHALNKRKHYSKVQHYSKWWRLEKRVYSSQVGFLVWLQTWSSPLLLLRIIILSKPSSLALKTASLTASWIAR